MAQRKSKPPGPPPRRRRGFEAAASLLGPRIQRAVEGRGFAVARLLTHWAEIAGEQLAGITRPVRISHGRGGMGATLTLLTTGPMAPLVEMQLPGLREKVNACYGYNAVSRITLTQTAPTGFAEGQARFSPAPAAPPRADPAAVAQADAVAGQFTDPDLSAAMARLAMNHAARQQGLTRKDNA